MFKFDMHVFLEKKLGERKIQLLILQCRTSCEGMTFFQECSRKKIVFICVLMLTLSNTSADSHKISTIGDTSFPPIDLANPIDIPAVSGPDEATNSRTTALREERNVPIVLYDASRDRKRLEQIQKMAKNDRTKEVINDKRTGEITDRIRELNRRRGAPSDSNIDRDRGRFLHSNGFNVNLNLNSVQKRPTLTTRRHDKKIQNRIMQERDQEINREVQKSLEIREKILRDNTLQGTTKDNVRLRQNGKLDKNVPASLIKRDGQKESDRDLQGNNLREADRALHVRNQRDMAQHDNVLRDSYTFIGANSQRNLDRTLFDKVQRNTGRVIHDNFQRERDRILHDKVLKKTGDDVVLHDEVQRGRDRSRHDPGNVPTNRFPTFQEHDSTIQREQERLAKRRGEPKSFLGIKEKGGRDTFLKGRRESLIGRDIFSKGRKWSLKGIDKYNRQYHRIVPTHTRPIYGIIEENTKVTPRPYQLNRHQTLKPPILVIEKIPVKSPKEHTSYYTGGTVIQSPISILHDERGASRPQEGFYMDRRPERPERFPSVTSEENYHVSEKILIGVPHTLQHLQGPLNFGNIGPPPLLQPVYPIFPANHAAHVSELDRINQATVLAELARLNRIKLAQAIHQQVNAEEIAAYNANKQAAHVIAAHAAHALATNNAQVQAQAVAQHAVTSHSYAIDAHAADIQKHAIDAHVANSQQQAIAAHIANKKKQAIAAHAENVKANVHVQAIIDPAANNQAINKQIILEDALKQQLILKMRFLDSHGHITAAQEVDLINLAVKNGIKEALKTQIYKLLGNEFLAWHFFQKLQEMKSDLLQRLNLLKPYFIPNHGGGYILPEHLPLLPSGVPLSSVQLSNLPTVKLSPDSLITPGFKFPQEMLSDTQNLDVRFIEYILRLPEPQFSAVMRKPKSEFLLSLFPRLYQEIYDDVSTHLHQMALNRDLNDQKNGENVQHNHYHIYHNIPEPTTHNFQSPALPLELKGPQDGGHFIHYDGYKSTTFTPSPQYHSPVFHEGQSSYSSYGHDLFGPQEDKSYTTPRLGGTFQQSYPQQPLSHLPTTSAPTFSTMIRGIQIRPKGYAVPNFSTTPLNLLKPNENDFLSPTNTFKNIEDIYQSIAFPNSHQDRIVNQDYPGSKHTMTKTTAHSVASSAPSIPQKSTILDENVFKHDSSADDLKTPKDGYIALYPFAHNQSPDYTSNLFRQSSQYSPILNYNIPVANQPSFTETSTSSYTTPETPYNKGHSTLTTHPFTTPLTFRPSYFQTPTSTTFFTHPPTTSYYQPEKTVRTTTFDAVPITTDFLGLDSHGNFGENKEYSPITTTDSPLFGISLPPVLPKPTTLDSDTELRGFAPFRGFTGNLQQKTIFERLDERDNAFNYFERHPGTDQNDDDHVISMFRKKKGNVTDFDTQTERSHHNSKDAVSKTSGNLNEEEKLRLRITNFQEEMIPKSSSELVIDKVKEIAGTVANRPQETPTVVKFAGVNLNHLSSEFFPGSGPSVANSDPNSNAIYAAEDSGQNRHPKQLIYSDNTQEIQDGGELSKAVPKALLSLIPKNTPKPQRIKNTPTPFINSRSSLQEVFISGEDSTSLNGSNIQSFPVSFFQTTPDYLKKAPSCSVTGTTKKSFCLYPEGYPFNASEKVISQHKDIIEEGLAVLKSLSEPKLDWQAALEQLPNLDLRVPCESENRSVKLSWSRDVAGSWFTVLQSGTLQQIVNVTTCGPSARINGCQPLLHPRSLVVYHPEDPKSRPLILDFPLPVGCVYVSH